MNKAAVAGIGAVVLVAGAYLGATAWGGQQAQARYRAERARVQARLPFLRVSEEKYDKGFFTSIATMTLQLGCPSPAGAQPATATITSTIHHGPLAGGTLAAAVIDSQLRLSGSDAQQVAAGFEGGVPLTVRTVVAFSGKARSTFESPAARLPTAKGGPEVAWLGLTGSLESSSDGRSLAYRIQSPGLSVGGPTGPMYLRVGALAFQGQGKAVDDSGLIVVGKAEGTLDSMEVAGSGAGDPQKVVFSGLKLGSETSLDGDLLGGTGTFSGAGTVGDVKIDRIDMQVSMKRIHAPTYLHLMQTSSTEIYRCDTPDKMAALLALQGKMKDDLTAMLRYGPQFSLDRLAVQSGGQTGEVSYSFGVDGMTAAEAQLPVTAVLMTHAQAKASARLPIDWLHRLSQAGATRLQGKVPDPSAVDVMLDQAQAQGYVVRDGDYVKSSAEFSKGTLTVNGKPLGPKPGG